MFRSVIIFFIVFFPFLVFSQSEDIYSFVNIGELAPTFTVRTIDGKVIDVDKLKGKVILVNFFATWCRPCMEEMPHINLLKQKYSDDELVIISIGREHQIGELEIFNRNKKFSFSIAADPDRKIYNMYAEKMIPRNYIINKKGILIYQGSGFTLDSFNQMVKVIEKELKTKNRRN
ncbi:MAG TPA: TlpA disulfide reductase family protein [Salinivirgaceae bacterium]|mgnify:CR=1 FL=1|nr:TlpA disulfide reductase family protein [Salinivirgaceae bacterium]